MKKILFITISVLLIIGLIGGVSYYYLRPVKTITFAIPWENEFTLDQIRRIVNRFSENKPKIEVELASMSLGELNDHWKHGNPGEVFDIGVSSSRYSESLYFEGESLWPWTGVIWSLYYNRELLHTAAGWDSNSPEKFQNGSAGLKDLESLCIDLVEQGITPFTVGAQYSWPLGALIQHIALFENPDIRLNQWNSEEDVPPVAVSAVDRFESWVKNGWLHNDYRQQDWPASVLQVAESEAAFVLIPTSLSSTIPFDKRETIGIISFPSGPDNSWAVGSLWYLAVPSEAEHPKAALELVKYLAEEENTKELQLKLGRRFFSWESAVPGRLAASVTDNIHSDFLEWLRNWMRKL